MRELTYSSQVFLFNFGDFYLNLLTLIINDLEVLFQHFIIVGPPYYYIITATGTALNDFTIRNAKGSVASAEKYFIIKKTSFLFGEKFATINNRRKYY